MIGYVSKNDTKPYRRFFDNWIRKIRPLIRREGLTFSFKLVGSAKRNLVIKLPNEGFDCDYQIFLYKNKENLKPRQIKDIFRREFDAVAKADGFKNCEDSTSALTIKLVDNAKSQLRFSYDVVILQERNGETEILRKRSENNKNEYVFELLRDMTNNRRNYKKIQGIEEWRFLRKIYYEKRMQALKTNDTRKSFEILNEAVNETLTHFQKTRE